MEKKVVRMAEYKVESVTLPAGEYWVGDPCYAVADSDLWLALLEQCGYFEKSVIAEVDGKWVIGITTAYGDGVYRDQYAREYPVDSGLIGVAPVADWVGEPGGMHRMEFDREFTVCRDDSRVVIGDVVIETDEEEV